MAVRIVSGYRTIAFEVAIILARTPPWDLVAKKYKSIYERFRQLKEEDAWCQDVEKTVKKEEEEKLMRSWKRILKDKNLSGVEIRNAANKVFTEWMNRSYG